MNKNEIKEIIACLPKERTLYRYHKDAYAVNLLKRFIKRTGTQSLSSIRQSRVGKLLSKPLLTEFLASVGDKKITVEKLSTLWSDSYENYVLTLDSWGQNRSYGYEQVSRPGANLVLQLNFSTEHDEIFKQKVFDDLDEFQMHCHPISKNRCTMAWARIDLEFDSDQALIEESQTDWLRDTNWLKRRCRLAVQRKKETFTLRNNELVVDNVFAYLLEVERHQKIWSEAMLNAAINFIADELGIKQIYYHSFETGAVLKHLKYSKPPRSLYTDLPKKFCFEAVDQGPDFICRNKKAKRRLKAMKNPNWFTMRA